LRFFPQFREAIAMHPEIYMLVLSGIFALLRAVTKGKLSIS